MVVAPVDRISPLLVKKIELRLENESLTADFAMVCNAPDKEFYDRVQSYDIQLTETYSVELRFWPNGVQEGGPVTLMISPQREDAKGLYVKFEVRMVASDNNNWFAYKMEEFIGLEFGLAWNINICDVKKIKDNPEHLAPKGCMLCFATTTIHTTMIPPPTPLRSGDFSEKIALIKDKIYQSSFGDMRIFVRQVEMYAHRCVLIRHGIFSSSVASLPPNSCLITADGSCPRVIEEFVVEAYLSIGKDEFQQLLS